MQSGNRTKFGQNKFNKSSGGNSKQATKAKGPQTTHYAYTLDEDGNKLFINELGIWEKEGKYGSYLSLKVDAGFDASSLNGKPIFIAKKKAKSE